jgi:protein-S-isoprenylcysteine O-methyltransferase Ste14
MSMYVEQMIRIALWLVLLVGGGVLSSWLDRVWLGGSLESGYQHLITFPLGVVIFFLVMRASRNTGRLLAELGRDGDLPRMATNRLVTTGHYACMRHPMHFGLLLLPWSVAFLLGSPSFIMVIAPLETALISAMVKWVEEPQAVRKFGEAYVAYRSRVPFFTFRPACLRALFGRAV